MIILTVDLSERPGQAVRASPATNISRNASVDPVIQVESTMKVKKFPNGTYFCGDTKQESGYLTLPNKKDQADKYFYWYFEARNKPTTAPFLIWLTGGPGCSSMVALLSENGPCTIQQDLSTKLNPYSWTNEANVLWLDQPTNVGFSYAPRTDNDTNEEDVAVNFYGFLQQWYQKHPELQHRPLYIAGESYAGHYVPAVAAYIHQQNVNLRGTTKSRYIPLNGIAIGNGWTDPAIQYEHVLDMVNNSYGIPLLNKTEEARLKKLVPQCVQLVQKCQKTMNTSVCADTARICNELDNAFATSGKNPFDIRAECPSHNVVQCNEQAALEKYLNQSDVKKELNVNAPNATSFTFYNLDVAHAFQQDQFQSYSSQVAELLRDGIYVWIYAGDADTACNWRGNLAWLEKVQWAYQYQLRSASLRSFYIDFTPVTSSLNKYTNPRIALHATPEDSEPVGSFISVANVMFTRIYKAGHMSPTSQPAVVSAMLHQFLTHSKG